MQWALPQSLEFKQYKTIFLASFYRIDIGDDRLSDKLMLTDVEVAPSIRMGLNEAQFVNWQKILRRCMLESLLLRSILSRYRMF